ncbi:MAG TPA: efflux RND transporter periplasmic adaptor subunit [Bacteroidales bacterium]|nr:efflux RND transporter periplasmic adaptor subunit [Bacteroidales bacterium]HOH84124.1 efflux RND transporter periplasmic adaptor subunit [Bacteroidales bacterium]
MKRTILLVSLIIFVASCNSGDKTARLEKLKKQRDKITIEIQELEKLISTESGKKVVPVAVTEIKPETFRHYLEVQGKVDGDDNVSVSAKNVGVITSINVKEGQRVSKGQLLATLDAQILYTTLRDMETQLEFVNDLYIRQKNLWDQKIGSEVQYLTAKNNKESLENKIQAMKDQIALSTITSPIDGTVEEISLKVGQAISPGYPTFRVVNFDHLKIVAEVAEAHSAKVKQGDSVRIYFPDFDEEIDSKLSFTSKYINMLNRTFAVEAAIPNIHGRELRANMIAVIKINDYAAPSAIAISANLIHKSMNEYYVFVAEQVNNEMLAQKRVVTTGVTYNGKTEILSGLQSGDNLITTGYNNLNGGEKIKF